MKKIITILFVLFSLNLIAQDEIISQEYYEGSINGNIEIALYLKIAENGCPNTYAESIYQYKKNESNQWILLETSFTKEMNQFTFVELFNTGILLLNKESASLNGLWLSPDGKKQLKVVLKKVAIDKNKIEHLEDQLEETYYNANDC